MEKARRLEMCAINYSSYNIYKQNCEVTIHESGDLLLTYLDVDPLGVKQRLKSMLLRRSQAGLNRVSWWGNCGLKIQIKDRFNFKNGP